MNVLTSLLSSEPQKPEQPKKRSLVVWAIGILLIALKWKWDSDFWKSKK